MKVVLKNTAVTNKTLEVHCNGKVSIVENVVQTWSHFLQLPKTVPGAEVFVEETFTGEAVEVPLKESVAYLCRFVGKRQALKKMKALKKGE